MTNREKISKLLEAKELLFEVMDLVKEVFPGDGNVEAYFIDQLAIHASDDHGFLSNDLNIDQLIERVGPRDFDENVYKEKLVDELVAKHGFNPDEAEELVDDCMPDVLDSIKEGMSFDEIIEEFVDAG